MPGSIGVHRISIDHERPVPPDETAREVQRLTVMLMAYIREMGVDPAILELALDIDSDDIRYLSGADMERYGVLTDSVSIARRVDPKPPSPRETPRQTSPAPDPSHIPVVHGGTIRHAKGAVALKRFADENAMDLALIPNGTRVEIIANEERWFRVRANSSIGYLHQTWVFVDEFMQSGFDDRYIQVKSVSRLDDAQAFVRGSQMPLAAVLASNGWYAITLDGTFNLADARRLLAALKDARAIPTIPTSRMATLTSARSAATRAVD